MTKSTVMYWNPLVPDSLLDLTIASKMKKHYMNRSWNTCQYAKTATLQANAATDLISVLVIQPLRQSYSVQASAPNRFG